MGVVTRRRLGEEALRITTEISSKHVNEPHLNEVQSNALIGLKRFAHSTRQQYHHRQRLLNSKSGDVDSDPELVHKESYDDDVGLGTDLYPKNGQHSIAPPGDEDCELFIQAVQRDLLTHLDKCMKNDPRKASEVSARINQFTNGLQKYDDIVFVETDKTNSRLLMKTEDYVKEVVGHLENDAVRTTTAAVRAERKVALKNLEEYSDMLSTSEYNYISSTINAAQVPTPRATIKDHKPKTSKGKYPTRLIVPATNFTSGFPHVGMKGIKNILDRNNINYQKYNILHAGVVKQKLDDLKIKKGGVSITSIDAEKMYPSIKFNMIRKAVEYFARSVSKEEKRTIRRCLEMIKYGMATTFIQFQDSYWIYGGMIEVDEKGLTIGGYESAWLADLVAAYILENSRSHFRNCIFDGTYRDDGLRITDGTETTDETCDWLSSFQSHVNNLLNSDKLQFTVEIWNPDAPTSEKPKNPKVKINRQSYFPYLDVEMFWYKSDLAR